MSDFTSEDAAAAKRLNAWLNGDKTRYTHGHCYHGFAGAPTSWKIILKENQFEAVGWGATRAEATDAALDLYERLKG